MFFCGTFSIDHYIAMCAFLGDRDRNKEMRDRRFSEVLRSASERGDVT